MANNVQVSIRWATSTIFASEPIDCTITFTNASNACARRSPSPNLRTNGQHREQWRAHLSEHKTHPPTHISHSTAPSTSLSLSREDEGGQARSDSKQNAGLSRHTPSGSHKNKKTGSTHRRSISIVSISGDSAELPSGRGPHVRTRPVHGRASSMQFTSRRSGAPSPTASSGLHNDRAFTLPVPVNHVGTSKFVDEITLQQGPRSHLKRNSTSTGSTKLDQNQLAGWRFPNAAAPEGTAALVNQSPTLKSPSTLGRATSPQELPSTINAGPPNLATRILSPGSVGGTPRSSGEFFSLSNNSTETIASDYPSREVGQLLPKPAHRRQGSSLGPLPESKTETLMMGYAEVMGSFSLDGSLVNQNPFEDVKRKAIVGGQGGGGLVRSASSRKRDSGLLSSFGWGNLGETFGGLLGDTGMSSIKEAKKVRGQKSIPILSAPQSILFVDLQLQPGESKSFRFSHPTPPGIPPSHRGKAIKIEYSLVIGTQRSTRIGQQNQIRRVEIPFKVLPSVNGQGNVLGHELTSPHTLLSNSATVVAIEDVQPENRTTTVVNVSDSVAAPDSFSLYVGKLLEQTQLPQDSRLLSPTEDTQRPFLQLSEQTTNVKELVDLAIVNSTSTSQSKRHANRFEIKKGGERVAVIILSRPAYRLGESVPIVVNFQEVDVACYSVHATLESSETVDPAIALRSKASIQRVTRRVHASYHEPTVSSKRVFFQPVIPVAATPDFITSGVSLEWSLRFEFVTGRSDVAEEYDGESMNLMEEIIRDDRGNVQAAVQGLACENFDVTVPINVYGAPAAFDEHTFTGPLSI